MSTPELNQEEAAACVAVFNAQANGEETITVWDMKSCMDTVGLSLSEVELFHLASQVDSSTSCRVTLDQFLRIVSARKRYLLKFSKKNAEDDMLETFVACGGRRNRTGSVSKAALTKILLGEFDMRFDINTKFDELDLNQTGRIDYIGFQKLLS